MQGVIASHHHDHVIMGRDAISEGDSFQPLNRSVSHPAENPAAGLIGLTGLRCFLRSYRQIHPELEPARDRC
jgi:hypothetical protein